MNTATKLQKLVQTSKRVPFFIDSDWFDKENRPDVLNNTKFIKVYDEIFGSIWNNMYFCWQIQNEL